MVMGFDSSSTTTFPTVKMVSKVGAGAQSAPVTVKASPTFYRGFDCPPNPCRWGDYAASTPGPGAAGRHFEGVVDEPVRGLKPEPVRRVRMGDLELGRGALKPPDERPRNRDEVQRRRHRDGGAGAAFLRSVSRPTPNDSGVRVRILDATCLGPCSPGTNPRPFEGTAEVVITRTRTDRRVASPLVTDGRLRKKLPPGRYSLVAQIEDPCWISQPNDVRVRPNRFARARLIVENGCIL